MKAPCTCGQPHFVQWFLQVHNNLAAVAERHGDHATHALVVDISIGCVVDAVTMGFYSAQQRLGAVRVFQISHSSTNYNLGMALNTGSYSLIVGTVRPWAALTALVAMLAIAGCGQKGGLYLPTEPAARDRATLPQVLLPATSAAPTAPATPASASR